MYKLLVLAVIALATPTSTLAAAGGCHAVAGTFVNHRIPCTVTAIVCVESNVTGGLSGTSTTLVTGFDPATSTYTGTVTNVLDNGAVITATIVGHVAAPGSNWSVETFTGGTRQFAHVTGSTFQQDHVTGPGTYSGQYCLGNGDDD